MQQKSLWRVENLTQVEAIEAKKAQERKERREKAAMKARKDRNNDETKSGILTNDKDKKPPSNENSPLQSSKGSDEKAGYGTDESNADHENGEDSKATTSCSDKCFAFKRKKCLPWMARYICCVRFDTAPQMEHDSTSSFNMKNNPTLAKYLCCCLSPRSQKDLRTYWASHFWTYFFLLTFLGSILALLTIAKHPTTKAYSAPPPYPTAPPSLQWLPPQHSPMKSSPSSSSSSSSSSSKGRNGEHGNGSSPSTPTSPLQQQPPKQNKRASGLPPPSSSSSSSPSGPSLTIPKGCNLKPCDINADCTDVDPITGSYSCSCRKGYVGDGKECVTPSKLGDHKFIFENNCNYNIWVGVFPPTVERGGFFLPSGKKSAKIIPQNFQGRFWPRTHCVFDENGQGNCLTGDCGQGLKCNGGAGKPPATLAEFNVDAGAPFAPSGVLDWYDVSLVDGYNVPVSIYPVEGTYQKDPYASNPQYDCANAVCISDINPVCPKGMQLKPREALSILPPNPNRKNKANNGNETIACHSACDAFADPKYCCTGSYALPTACPPTKYSEIFKESCPGAYSYAYDDKSSLFTCRSAVDTVSSYTIMFC